MDGAKFMRANLTGATRKSRAAGWHRGAFDRSVGFDELYSMLSDGERGSASQIILVRLRRRVICLSFKDARGSLRDSGEVRKDKRPRQFCYMFLREIGKLAGLPADSDGTSWTQWFVEMASPLLILYRHFCGLVLLSYQSSLAFR